MCTEAHQCVGSATRCHLDETNMDITTRHPIQPSLFRLKAEGQKAFAELQKDIEARCRAYVEFGAKQCMVSRYRYMSAAVWRKFNECGILLLPHFGAIYLDSFYFHCFSQQ